MKRFPLKKAPTATSTPLMRRLQLEDFDLIAEGFFVGFEHADDVFAVFFLANEETALDVLRFPAGFDDVAVGILLDEFDSGIEESKSS